MSIRTNSYVIFCGALLGAAHTQAVDYPERPVRLIVPFAPGAGQDITGHLLAQRLTDAWSQQVVVDNRPGAGSNIGAELGARAPADDYTNTTMAQAIDNAEVRKRYAAEGGEAVGSTSEQASKYLQAEVQRWAKVIKEAGVRSE